MKVETRKTLILTKAEQKAIHDVYKILEEDDSLDVYGVWDILTDIYLEDTKHGCANDCGYNIEIVN